MKIVQCLEGVTRSLLAADERCGFRPRKGPAAVRRGRDKASVCRKSPRKLRKQNFFPQVHSQEILKYNGLGTANIQGFKQF